MNRPGYPQIAVLFPDQDREAAAMLARALVDDPSICVIVGEGTPSERIRRMTRLFGVILGTHRRDGQPVIGVIADGQVACAALFEQVTKPEGAIKAAIRGLPFTPAMLRVAGLKGVRRALSALDVVTRNRPREPHLYLRILGVEPAMQRRHCGVAMLNYLRDQVALRADVAGVYLETATAANVAYYTKAGYETIGELTLLGVRIWQMLQRRG